LGSAIAVTTSKTYYTGWRQWELYCGLVSAEIWQPSESLLVGFVSWLSLARENKPKGLSVSAMRCYLAAIKYFHSVYGHNIMDDYVVLEKVIRGYKRTRGVASKPMRPVTIALLKLIHPLVTNSYMSTLFWALLSLAVHGMFRSGELAPSSEKEAIRQEYPKWSDVTWLSDTHITIRLAASKTDPFKKGVRVHVFATLQPTCPVLALLQLHWMRPPHLPDSLIFSSLCGKPVLKSTFITILRTWIGRVEGIHHLGLESTAFNGHSLRRGGATSLALAGVPDTIIMAMGRWRSSSYRSYIDTPIGALKDAFRLYGSDHSNESELAAARTPFPPYEWDRQD
jgi:hypothetical protein